MKITHRIEPGPGHTVMTLWVDGANIGTLTVGNDQTEALDSIVNLLRGRLEGIDVVREYDELPKIACLAGQINQVFMHLIANAADALDGKGKIWIRALNLGGGHVAIEVEDDGPGIDPSLHARIFDPFFTTKPVGAGTGLGLSVSYGVVERHGGRIQLQSTPGEGARFRVELSEKKELAPNVQDVMQAAESSNFEVT
jgi:two-component system NtrC family sensor kinase